MLRPGMLCKPRCNKKVIQFKTDEVKWAQMSYKRFSQLRQSYLLQTMIESPTWCLIIRPFTVVNNKLWHEPKLTITIIKAVQVVICKPLINYIYIVSHSEHKSTIRAILSSSNWHIQNNLNNLVIWAQRLQKYNTMTNTARAVKIL